MIQRNNRIEEPFHKNVSFMLLTYWGVLVLWQNLSRIQARTTIDLLIKIGLLIYFSGFYLHRVQKIGIRIILPLLMLAALLITSTQETELTIGILINYFYPIQFTLMAYGIGNKFEISKKHLSSFCNGIVLITMYSALYALFFCTDQFLNAFLIRNAYGNELSSFFISPHEYGMYVAAGSISCLIWLKLNRFSSYVKKIPYYVALVILLLNLILTFSRTSTFSMAIFLFIYTIYENKGKRRKMLMLMFCTVCVVLLNPVLRGFVFNIVMKGNDLGVREEIYSGTLNIFKDAPVFEKIFGFGINRTNILIRTEFDRSSAHNAYLQILLNYGLVGLLFLLGFIASQVFASLKFMKISKYYGGLSLGLCIMASAMMFTNTAIVFTSPIDSYFLTIFMFVVPKYVRNAIRNNRFE